MSESEGLELQQSVRVIEEFGAGETGGNYQTTSLAFNVDADSGSPKTWQEFSFSFPIPITAFSSGFVNQDVCKSDVLEFEVSPDTIVGAISANVAVDDEWVATSPATMANLVIGRWVKLDDGTDSRHG